MRKLSAKPTTRVECANSFALFSADSSARAEQSSRGSDPRPTFRHCVTAVLLSIAALAAVACLGSAAHQSAPARPQVWEKSIAPGLVYRMEYDPARPMVLNAIRWTLKAPSVHAEPQLAGGTVYEENQSKGRGTVTQMVAETHALAGINADFFPFTGHPLGLTVKDGQLLSLPRPGRSAFAWGPEQVQIGTATFSGQILVSGGPTIPIDGLNEEAKDDGVVVDDDAAGFALAPKAPSVTVVLRVDNPTFAPSTSIDPPCSSAKRFAKAKPRPLPVVPDAAALAA